jgi:hypothetical protein
VPESEFELTAAADAEAQPRAEELKTVIYSFEELRDPARPPGALSMHLVRREMDWSRAHPAVRNTTARVAHRSTSPTQPAEMVEGSSEAMEIEMMEVGGDEIIGDSFTSVPEVIDFSMRYFDGAAWSGEWDSTARRGLPVAVEVAVRLRSYDQPEPASVGGASEPGVDDERVLESKHPTYTLLISLAAAADVSVASGSLSGGGQAGASTRLGANSDGGFGGQ